MTVARRLAWSLFAAALAGGTAVSAAHGADAWAGLPSYHSHRVPPHLAAYHPVPVPAAAYRPAVVSTAPGFSLEAATRVNRVLIRGGGGSVDVTIFHSERVAFPR